MKIVSAGLAAFGLMLLPEIALAQPSPDAASPGRGYQAGFLSRADVDGDGLLSLEEYLAFHQERAQWRFNQLDTNQDGYLDSDEIQAGFGKARKGGQGMKQGRGPTDRPQGRFNRN